MARADTMAFHRDFRRLPGSRLQVKNGNLCAAVLMFAWLHCTAPHACTLQEPCAEQAHKRGAVVEVGGAHGDDLLCAPQYGRGVTSHHALTLRGFVNHVTPFTFYRGPRSVTGRRGVVWRACLCLVYRATPASIREPLACAQSKSKSKSKSKSRSNRN